MQYSLLDRAELEVVVDMDDEVGDGLYSIRFEPSAAFDVLGKADE